jgi:hypothetical protein
MSYASVVSEHGINGAVLLFMIKDDWQYLGMTVFGDQ